MMLRKSISSTAALAIRGGHAQLTRVLPANALARCLAPSPAAAPMPRLLQASRFSTTPAPLRGVTPADLTPDQQEEFVRRKAKRDALYAALNETPTDNRVSFDYLVEKCVRSWTLNSQSPATRETVREWIGKHKWMYRVFDNQFEGDGQWTCSKERVDLADMRVIRWWSQLYVDIDGGPEIDMADVLASIPPPAPESPESLARRQQVKELREQRLAVDHKIQLVREEQERLKKTVSAPDEARFRQEVEQFKLEQERHKERTAQFNEVKKQYEEVSVGPKEVRKRLAEELRQLRQERKKLLEQENAIYGVGTKFKKDQKRLAKKKDARSSTRT